MRRVYYLKTCNTCMRILKSLTLPEYFQLQDVKEKELTVEEVEHLYKLAGSYESLFNRRSKLYKEMGLKDLSLTENDYHHYLLDHYTFLKRPVFVIDDHIFIGNSKKNIEAVQSHLELL